MKFRYAVPEDTEVIYHFINEMAIYEKMTDIMVATPEALRKTIFEDKCAEVIFACEGEKEVGFALFFYNYSTFLAKPGLYLEDLFVLPEYRGKGYGKALLRELARIAVSKDCGRFQWVCLDWNQPSIDFYESLGADGQREWINFRMVGDALKNFAESED